MYIFTKCTVQKSYYTLLLLKIIGQQLLLSLQKIFPLLCRAQHIWRKSMPLLKTLSSYDYAFVRLIIAMPLYAVQYRTMLSRSGRDRNFIDPSIPQENRLCSGPMATCVTPEVEPMFLKNVLLLCSPGKLTTNWWTSNPHTCKMIKEHIIIKTLYHQPRHNSILTTSFIFFKITKKKRNVLGEKNSIFWAF